VLLTGASLVAWFNLRSGGEAVVETLVPVQVEPSPLLDEWRVAVAPFDNRTGDPALDPIGRTLTDRVMEGLGRIDQGLQSLTPVTVLAADASDSVVGIPADERHDQVGRLLVTGFFSDHDAALEVEVQVRDPDTRGVLYATGPVEVPRRSGGAELEPLLEKIMGAVATHVHFRLENISHVPDYTVFREYLGGVEDNWSQRDRAGGKTRIEHALEMDPEFLLPAVWLAGAALLQSQPDRAAVFIDHIRARARRLTDYESLCLTALEAWRDGTPARGVHAARELQRIAPHDVIVRFMHARLAGELGEYDEVVATLAGAIEHIPRPYQTLRTMSLRQLTWAYHELGRFEESLALARRLRQDMPGDTQLYIYEAKALASLGRLDELAETVEACERVPGGQCDAARVLSEASWNLAAHGHRDAARSCALRSVEMYRSRAENEGTEFDGNYLFALRAAELWGEYRQVAQLGVDQSEEGSANRDYALCAVGMAAAHLGDRAEAEAIMTRFETEEDLLYAGYVAAHLGELDRAVEYFKRSVASTSSLGYDQFLRWDLDLEPLWDYQPFQEMVKPAG
jgi:tetratricopeptide (TPR) repeat protein/TolB-like protein